MDEGVEAGEDEEGHHGAQRHHVVELGLQQTASVLVPRRPIQCLVGGARGGVLQPAGEVLKKEKDHRKLKRGEITENSRRVLTKQILSGGYPGFKHPPSLKRRPPKKRMTTNANVPATYHGGRHEEVPWQEGSQAHDEEDDPYRVVPGE